MMQISLPQKILAGSLSNCDGSRHFSVTKLHHNSVVIAIIMPLMVMTSPLIPIAVSISIMVTVSVSTISISILSFILCSRIPRQRINHIISYAPNEVFPVLLPAGVWIPVWKVRLILVFHLLLVVLVIPVMVVLVFVMVMLFRRMVGWVLWIRRRSPR